MSILRFKFISSLKIPKRSFSFAVNSEDEYSATPNYPPIKDTSRKGIKLQDQEDFTEQMKYIETVEEKMIKFNLPKYYGFKTVLISSRKFPYDPLPFIQNITKTAMIDELPEVYSTLKEDSASIAEEIKSQVIDVLNFEHEHKRWKYDHIKHEYSRSQLDDIFAKSIIEQINRIIINNLSSKKHLFTAQIDNGQKINSFWTVGGFDPPKQVRRFKLASSYLKLEADFPVDHHFAYQDSLALNLRHNLPLPIFKDLKNLDLSFLEIPKFKWDPRVKGYEFKRRHLTSIPGYWPGETNDFSFLSFNTCGHLQDRYPHYGESDYLDTIKSQGILTAFSYLMAQSFYLGFTTINELTYPLTTQTVITDGRLWSIFAYQLNTTLLYSNHIEDETKKNICWGVDRLPLFENFVDGKIIGFNEQTLQQLVSLYLITPQSRPEVDLRPNLGLDGRYIADIIEEDRRIFLERKFKFLPHGIRPPNSLPEIYSWERIYKLKNNTRPMDPKRRPFELGINPYKRTLDDEKPKYIPKALRKPGRYRQKFENTFWP